MAGSSVWYVETDTHNEMEESTAEDVIDFDFLKLKLKHIIKHRNTVNGFMLVTPKSFIFDPESSDPLDRLEPEMFQVAATAKKINRINILTKYIPNDDEGFSRDYKENIHNGPLIDSGNIDETVVFEHETLYEDDNSENNLPSLSFVTEYNTKEVDDKETDLFVHFIMDNREDIDNSIYFSSYGSSYLLKSYWFIVHENQANHLHSFFNTWFGDKYMKGDSNDDILDKIADLEIVQDFYTKVDECVSDGSIDESEEATELKEIRNIDKTEFIRELPIEINNKSQLLTTEIVKDLASNLPSRCVSHSWQLIFSTWQDGFSLHSLYRNCSKVDSPVLLAIRDSQKVLFGILVSDAPRISENFIGTGESWLFTYKDGNLVVNNWTGLNMFIMQGQNRSLCFGSDENGLGLWMDENLHHGSSAPVATFGSLCLTNSRDFLIENIECWTFS